MTVSREEVLLAFQLILGREPGSEPAIEAHMQLPDTTALSTVLLQSKEFAESPRFKDFLQIGQTAVPKGALGGVPESRARAKVLIFGNRQVEAVGRIMQAMTGDMVAKTVEVTPQWLRQLESGECDLGAELENCDLVFVQLLGRVTQLIQERYRAHAAKVRQFPPITWTGFHPDCIHIVANGAAFVQGPMGDYHSSIAFWAWQQGWSPKEALALFTAEAYELLDFQSYEQTSRKLLVEFGRATDFAIGPLLDRWMSKGVWMHTINHPRIPALVDLTAELLRREGIEPMLPVESLLEDKLARDPVWPVYPPLARRAADEGSYLFKVDRGYGSADRPVIMLSLEEFVQASFKVYDAHRELELAPRRRQDARYAALASLRPSPGVVAVEPPDAANSRFARLFGKRGGQDAVSAPESVRASQGGAPDPASTSSPPAKS